MNVSQVCERLIIIDDANDLARRFLTCPGERPVQSGVFSRSENADL
jgi:hypothetical protein